MRELKEVTAKELVKAFEGKLVEVIQEDEYGNGIFMDMQKAQIEYDEMDDRLIFTIGNNNTDGIGLFSISNVSENTESIVRDDDCYVIIFAHNISKMVVSRFKSLEDLEKERAERKQQ